LAGSVAWSVTIAATVRTRVSAVDWAYLEITKPVTGIIVNSLNCGLRATTLKLSA
jgi:hypothetical protein